MRFRPAVILLASSLCTGFLCASAATLEQLSTDRLIDESTEIVRGTVSYCSYLYRAPMIWTVCEVNVTERFKGSATSGAAATKVQVAIPGGVASGYRQTFEGTPALERNSEYLFFLWQGKSGLKQIMGLSQGLLSIAKDEKGNLVAVRPASAERMINASGQPVQDPGWTSSISDLAGRIQSRSKGGPVGRSSR